VICIVKFGTQDGSKLPTSGKRQTKWGDLWNGDIIAGATQTLDAYTVPKGYRLLLGGGFVSCDKSGMQLAYMTHTPGIVGFFRYDMLGSIVFGRLAAPEIPAEDTLTYHLVNNLDEDCTISISLTGILEKV